MARVPLYAVYGSNLDPAQMGKRAPRSPLFCTGWLEGWRLTFGGDRPESVGPLATLVERADASVFVALYDVASRDEPSLDAWEGTGPGVYSRIRVRANTLLEGEVAAWTHVLDDYEGGLPSARYLGALAEAAEKAGAPAGYVAELRRRPCHPVGM